MPQHLADVPKRHAVTYENAVAAAERAAHSENERSRRQGARFLITRTCSVCHGTRLRPESLTSLLDGRTIADIATLELQRVLSVANDLPASLPAELSRLTTGLLTELSAGLRPLLKLGLGYLSLDREGATLSTGERQRIELTSTVRANTTGMLYVLDEPSVGLHPSNVEGLRTTIAALVANGDSVVVVEHDIELIRGADWIIELGPGAGEHGGTIVAEGTPDQLQANPRSVIGPFLSGRASVRRERPSPPASDGRIVVEVGELYNLRGVTAAFPVHGLSALAGPAGAGKTALVLDSLVPAARAVLDGLPLPE
ncbi:MAG: excinuclease ABC subunit UvrA, partial [Solirubrobacteraceae bacterium]